MATGSKFLPIVYVRGYAGSQSEVEETVDDPFYGFGRGSTHVRIGPDGDAQFFGFESPLVRLITDWNYRDVYDQGSERFDASRGREAGGCTLWIFRYYDPTSKTFKGSQGKRLTIEEAANDLRAKIEHVKKVTGAAKVYLVAHSMGGLVSRCLLQKIYPEAGEEATDHVDKLFTFGTPHGGIHFDVGGGVIEWIRDQVGWNNADDFGRDRMYQYLTAGVKGKKKAPASFDPRDLQDTFPPERVFCAVGTNAHDYEVAFGLSRRSVGPQSDGLVQIQHAHVKGSSRAFIHRSHSGRYGIVNSEEGFQNLQRFLFGRIRTALVLCDLNLPQQKNVTYQAEVSVSIRGLPILVQEQTAEHFCPIPLGNGKVKSEHLYTSFLLPSHSATNDNTARFSIRLGILRIREQSGIFSFAHHLEKLPLWSDYLIIDVQPKPTGAAFFARYAWLSECDKPIDEYKTLPHEITLKRIEGEAVGEIPLPRTAVDKTGPSVIRIETSLWD
jgi:hypothetical protein